MIHYTTDIPAQHRKAVVLCCDADFAKFAFFVIAQLISQHPDRDFDICLCSAEDLAFPRTIAIDDLRICKFSAQEKIVCAPQSDRINLAAYLRLFDPNAFGDEYDRILYVDSDVWLCGGDISKLLDIPLIGQHPIAAVRTSHQRDLMSKLMPEFKFLGLSAAPYFNSGLLLIDVPRWIKADVLGQSLEVIEKHSDALVMHDQSVLNIILRDQWSELSFVWNWMYSGRFSYLIESFSPFVLHFAGKKKPWNTLSGEFPPKYSNAYRDFFLLHYPKDGENQQLTPSVLAAAKSHKWSLLKQWWDFDRLAKYMGRFDDPYVAIDPRSR